MIRIAIADDEAYILRSVTNRIRMARVDAMVAGCASDGHEAMALLEKEQPDIFLVDINMPGMSGLEFIDRARHQYPELHTRFVILSGYDDFCYLKESIRLGVCDYLRKPIQQEEFRQLLEKLCKLIVQEKEQRRAILKNKYIFLEEFQKNVDEEQDGTFIMACARELVPHTGEIPLRSLIRKMELPGGEAMADIQFVVFPGVRNAVGLYFPGQQLSRHSIARLGEAAAVKMPVRWYYAYTGSQPLEMILHDLEDGMNIRFSRPDANYVYIESQAAPSPEGLDDLEMVLGNGSLDNALRECRNLLKEAIDKEYRRLNDLYRRVIIMLMNQLSRAGLSVPPGLHKELYLFTLTKYEKTEQLLEAVSAYIVEVKQTLDVVRQKGDLAGRVTAYLDSHFRENIALNDLAEIFFVAPTYLSKRFKEKTGVNITQYLEKQKLAYASKMLRKTDLPVADIAADVGYMDSNYFARVFKKSEGMTPSEYRAQYRKEE